MKTLLSANAPELLQEFNAAGVLDAADVQIARRLMKLCQDTDQTVALATALTIRALRAGSVCIDLTSIAEQNFDTDDIVLDISHLPWPDPVAWIAAVEASPMVTLGESTTDTIRRPLRMVDGNLYLERYWEYEEAVRQQLLSHRNLDMPIVEDSLAASLTRYFPRSPELSAAEDDLQAAAAQAAARHSISVVAGGPGTGKTTTVAKILAVLSEQSDSKLQIALAAPTGKAAARLSESLRSELEKPDSLLSCLAPEIREQLHELSATTLHRLLGYRPDNRTRFRHDCNNPLPYDVIVVDESSMVSIHLMDRLLAAIAPNSRLILVGDPDQLASVEAGTVLSDIVRAKQNKVGVTVLSHTWRFGAQIDRLARAIREGDPKAALSVLELGGDTEILPFDVSSSTDITDLRSRVVKTHEAIYRAAAKGDAEHTRLALNAMDSHRVLCAHNHGPFGITSWQHTIEGWLAEASPDFYSESQDFYVGRPLLISQNCRDISLNNGDTGVVVATEQGPRAAFICHGEIAYFSSAQLPNVSTLHAMTVHKSQGSQYEHVTLILPPVGSPLLRRELLYTAVTRAKKKVTIIGSEDAITQAITSELQRASGLGNRL
ncbi:MAG: exodeoxyribonuclease V subunit alpha [Propionibacteriaceae bacterium]